MDIKVKLWDRIRTLRKEKAILQEELAWRAGLHRTYLSTIERGIKNVSVENIEKIALGLGVEIKDLFK